MPSPIETARALYLTGGEDTWESDLAAHEKVGHVLSTPPYFIMWRCCEPDWPLDRLLDPQQAVPHGTLAFIWVVSGDWQQACLDALEVTPWVTTAAFERRGRPRFLSIPDVLR